MKKKFTDRFVQQIKFDGKIKEYVDDSPSSKGLRLRVFKTQKVFSILYVATDGVRKRFGIGGYPSISLKDARIEYNSLKAEISKGRDPAEEKKQTKKASRDKSRETLTFEELSDLFIKQYLSENAESEKTIKDYTNQMKKDVYPVIGSLRVNGKEPEIQPIDIKKIRDAIYDRGAKVVSNRVLMKISQTFSWGIEEILINYNPASDISSRYQETGRDVNLDNDQIKTFWNRFGEEDASELITIAVKLELCLGQRVGEIINMNKELMNIDSRPHYLIPSTKNNSMHILPLNSISIGLIKRAMELSSHSKFLFPSPVGKGAKPMTTWAVIQTVARRREELGFHFTSHDLRRTLNTGLAALGYDEDQRNRITNHKGVGSVNNKVYNWHHYEPEMRRALEDWSNHLTEVLEDRVQEDNIISIIRAAKKAV